jgi:release factor glutamine methyltransferase
LAIKKIKSSAFDAQNLKILDIGTGSGIIPLVLKNIFRRRKLLLSIFLKKHWKLPEKMQHFISLLSISFMLII